MIAQNSSCESIHNRCACLPAVLVPGFDLGVGEVEFGGEFHAVLHAEVLLALEGRLERIELMISESRAGFTLLLRLGAAILATRRNGHTRILASTQFYICDIITLSLTLNGVIICKH